MARSTAASFQVFLCQYVYKLTVWNVVDILAWSSKPFSLQSPFAILQLSHCSILLAFIFIFLFSRAVAIAISLLLFSQLGLPCAILCFSPPFLFLAAIFIAMPFTSLPSILSLFSQQYHGFSFKAGLGVAVFAVVLSSLPYSICY